MADREPPGPNLTLMADLADGLRLDEIVLRAAALDENERTVFLDQLSISRPDLLAEARRLLRAAGELSESFLAEPAGGLLDRLAQKSGRSAEVGEPPARAAPAALHGEERYRLGERVGTGGMAEVFRAHDRQLDRPVALKLLHADDPRRVERCLAEARAQARVRHQHVLEVYDAGDFGGRPFIAMRLVEGQPLLAMRDGHSLEQQVRLLIQAARGLDAAHRTGLIHRDVKPANILVERTLTGDLKAWVTDFGIAGQLPDPAAQAAGDAAIDDREATGGGIVGTAHYVAPERLGRPREAVDRRSDVFSFGVTLYETLTGARPFGGDNLISVLSAVRERTPTPPRELVPTLPVELEAIILECLHKEPQRRYGSARAVAEELERFLAGEPVEAHTASLAYRLTRFAMRHKNALLVAAVGAALLLVALIAAAWLGVRAMRANIEVEQRRTQAEELIDFMLLDLRQKLEDIGGLDMLDDVGKRAMRYFSSVPHGALSDQELARRTLALYQIGEVRVQQGKLDQALAPFEHSLRLAQILADRHAGQADHGERLFDLGQSHFWVGFVHWRRGDLEAATAHFMSYLAISERLVEMVPERAGWRLELAHAHSNLGTVLRDSGDLGGARERYATSLRIKERLTREQPENASYRLSLGAAHNTLGVVLERLGEAEAARRHFETDLALRRALVASEPQNLRWREWLGVSHNYLGNWFLSRGHWSEAAEHFATAVELYEALVAADATNADRLHKLAINLGSLGRARFGLEGAAAARDLFSSQCQRAEALIALDPTRRDWRLTRVVCGTYLAATLGHLGGHAEARAEFEHVQGLLDALVRQAPEDREVQRRRVEALVQRSLFETAATDRHQAAEQWRRAEAAAAPFVERRQQPMAVAAWVLALEHLDRAGETQPARAWLVSRGFCAPFYSQLCPSPSRSFLGPP